MHAAAKSGQIDAVRVLARENKATLKDLDDHLRTPLHLAARDGHLPTLLELIDLGADTKSK